MPTLLKASTAGPSPITIRPSGLIRTTHAPIAAAAPPMKTKAIMPAPSPMKIRRWHWRPAWMPYPASALSLGIFGRLSSANLCDARRDAGPRAHGGSHGQACNGLSNCFLCWIWKRSTSERLTYGGSGSKPVILVASKCRQLNLQNQPYLKDSKIPLLLEDGRLFQLGAITSVETIVSPFQIYFSDGVLRGTCTTGSCSRILLHQAPSNRSRNTNQWQQTL